MLLQLIAKGSTAKEQCYVTLILKQEGRGMIMKRAGILVLFVVFSLIVTAAVCMADCSVITVHYNERVPYLKITTNGVEGLTGTPAVLAFKKAEIPFILKNQQ